MDFSQNLQAIEIISVLCSLIFIGGIIKHKIWAWWFGIIASALAAVLFYYSNLFSEVYLQVFYAVLGFYGWWRWKSIGEKAGSDKSGITDWTFKTQVIVILSGYILVLVSGTLFEKYTRADYPYVDAFTSVFGMIATIMEARKIFSCWYYWIVINGVSIWLYFQKDLEVYGMLAIVFTTLSIWGYFEWSKIIRLEKESNSFG